MTKNTGFTRESLGARLDELTKLEATARKELDPLTDARDKMVGKHQVDLDVANARIREVRQKHDLAAWANERAMITRALGTRNPSEQPPTIGDED